MAKKTAVPKVVRAHISNARYYYAAAQRLPSPIADGIRIFLLLTAWENYTIALEELGTYVWKTPLPKKLRTDHEFKLQGVKDGIIQIVDAGRGHLRQQEYWRPSDLKKLLETCRYGPTGGSSELASYFATRWHTDEFERDLDSKLRWIELEVKIFDDLQAGKL